MTPSKAFTHHLDTVLRTKTLAPCPSLTFKKRMRFAWAMANKQIVYTRTIKPFVIINN